MDPDQQEQTAPNSSSHHTEQRAMTPPSGIMSLVG